VPGIPESPEARVERRKRARPDESAATPSVATLLAQMLGADEWWTNFAAQPDDDDWRDVMAAHALDLYRQTATHMRARIDVAGHPEPIDSAVEVLREMADACALLSYPWTPTELANLRVPNRVAIEQAVRSEGLDDWVTGLGYILELRTSGGIGKWWPPAGGQEADAGLAERFAEAVHLNGVVLEARATSNGWDVLRAEMFRRGACRHVAVARSWLLWARRRGSAEAVHVAYATLLMSQMFFVASRDADFVEELFPSQKFLRELLSASGGGRWLRGHGVKPPTGFG
jgi:hypothetical protein